MKIAQDTMPTEHAFCSSVSGCENISRPHGPNKLGSHDVADNEPMYVRPEPLHKVLAHM